MDILMYGEAFAPTVVSHLSHLLTWDNLAESPFFAGQEKYWFGSFARWVCFASPVILLE